MICLIISKGRARSGVPTEEGLSNLASNVTEQVAQWFESDQMRPHLETLVQAWNTAELLSIDLADQLRKLLETSAARGGVEVSDLDSVNWSLLAEKYAEDICGVSRDELVARHEKYASQ